MILFYETGSSQEIQTMSICSTDEKKVAHHPDFFIDFISLRYICARSISKSVRSNICNPPYWENRMSFHLKNKIVLFYRLIGLCLSTVRNTEVVSCSICNLDFSSANRLKTSPYLCPNSTVYKLLKKSRNGM